MKSLGTLIGSILLFVLIGTAGILGWFGLSIEATSFTFFTWTAQLPMGVQAGIGFILILMDIYLMQRITNDYELYNTRSYFTSALFLLFMCGAPFTLLLTGGIISLTLTLTGISILLSSYQQERSVSEYMSAFALFGIATLFVPQWIYLLPFFFIGCSVIGTLTLRTFLTSLVGLITPYWIAAGVLFLIDDMDGFRAPFCKIVRFNSIHFATLPIGHIASLLLVTLLSLPVLITYLPHANMHKERTRVAFSFLIILFIGALLLCSIQPTLIGDIFPLLACLSSFLITRALFSASPHSRGIYLMVIAVLLILYLTRPLWMPSLTF